MNFFIPYEKILATAASGHYDAVLVLLSFAIAAIASYVALFILLQITPGDDRSRQRGCILGALVMGTGIWSMHFTGMLAFKIDMVHSYRLSLTALSMAIAVGFSWAAFRNITRRQLTLRRILFNAPLMGLGIASMHYVGMSAMQMEGDVRYIAWLFWLSVGIAIVISGVAMWIMRRVFDTKEHQQLWHIFASITLALAVCSMHYTGMKAAVFIPYAACRLDPNQDHSALIGCIVIANIAVIFLALFQMSRDISELKKTEVKLREATQRLQHIFDHIGEGIYGLDLNGHTIFGNKAAEKMLGYALKEMLHQSQHELIHHHHADGTLYPKEQCNIYHAFKDGKLHKEDKEVFWRKDGSCFPVEYSSSPMRNAEGAITGAVVIFRNIAERKEVEKKLKSYAHQLESGNAALAWARQKAERATQEKSQFVASISHELRTPLNGILGMAYLLGDTPLNTLQREYIDTINHSAQNLLLLINDVLDMSKIEAGELVIEKTPFDIKTDFMQTINLLKSLALNKGIALLCHIDPAMPGSIIGDHGRFVQIVTNLVGNAIKFTEKGSVEASLRYDAENHCIHCEVKNTGIGIPESKRHAIFEKFVQGDASITQKYGGTGLGLAITKRLVVMLGGEIDFESEVNAGARFWFTLPAELPDTAAAAHCADTVVSAPAAGRIDVREARVLIAEDNPVNQMFLMALLKKFGFAQIEVAENGLEVMGKLESNHLYHAIFMDCRMPEIDGYETTRRIRKRERNTEKSAHILIIAMTANALSGDREACFEAGMDEYLSKPLQPDRLKGVLKQWFIFSSSIEPPPSSAQLKSTAPPINFERLNMGAQTEQGKAELLVLFFRLAEGCAAIMEKARRNEEFPQWRDAAHSLRGSAANLGMAALEEICRQSEKAAGFTYDQRTALLAKIKDEIKRVKTYIAQQNPSF